MRKYFAGLVIAALLGAPQANAEEGSTQQATSSASDNITSVLNGS